MLPFAETEAPPCSLKLELAARKTALGGDVADVSLAAEGAAELAGRDARARDQGKIGDVADRIQAAGEAAASH